MPMPVANSYFVSKCGVLSHNAGKKKKKCEPPKRGGAYGKVRSDNAGGEVHHMPSKAAIDDGVPKLTKGTGPAIWMRTRDHRKTRSISKKGDGGAGTAYVEQQKELLKKNMWCRAINMDLRDVRKIHRTRYNLYIDDYLEYVAFVTKRICKGF